MGDFSTEKTSREVDGRSGISSRKLKASWSELLTDEKKKKNPTGFENDTITRQDVLIILSLRRNIFAAAQYSHNS